MPAVLFEKKGHVALVTINRPDARNALNPEAMILLARAWEQVRDDADIRVAVITGAGDDAFCSGADLKRMITLISMARKPEDEWDHEYLKNVFIGETSLLRGFDTVKPVIAAINGMAVAGGMELAQATDIRICADDAQFGLQEVKWGLVPLGGSTVRLPAQVPFAVAMELLLTGDLIDAQRAYQLGFVNHVVPKSQVLAKAMEIAHKIAGNGPLAVKAIRKSARENLGREEKAALDHEKIVGAPVFFSKDAKEGPRAFAEKRQPNFTGT